MKKNNDELSTMTHSRLHWACRRGMLELDVLLGNFLHEAYDTLEASDQADFVTLLTYPDPEIMAWIMGRESAPTKAMALIAKRIHDHALSRL